MHATIKI